MQYLNKMYKIVSLLFLVLSTVMTFAQNNSDNDPLNIKSVILRPNKANTFEPIIRLGEKLNFSFDDLDGDDKEYTYKISHYDYNWEESKLNSSEYSTGFSEDRIRTSENSFNTYQDYTHYELQIPNTTIRLKYSGNYKILIFDEDENFVFSRRFIVYQPKVDVGVSIHKARNIAAISNKQNIEFIINHPDFNINNPSEEIKVALYQNNDWNNVIIDLKPQFYRGTQLIYKYGDKSTFFAGNEYLHFDSKDIRSATNNIRRVELIDLFNTRLYVDEQRTYKPHTYYPDINGNFFIRTVNERNSTYEADYTKVHFGYDYNDNLAKGEDIYVYGAFNDWQLNDENRLHYNKNTQFYETDIILKQGFYNYTYVSANEDLEIDNLLEGSHYQTENQYNVLVYYKKFGSKYTEVIGYGSGSSVNLRL